MTRSARSFRTPRSEYVYIYIYTSPYLCAYAHIPTPKRSLERGPPKDASFARTTWRILYRYILVRTRAYPCTYICAGRRRTRSFRRLRTFREPHGEYYIDINTCRHRCISMHVYMRGPPNAVKYARPLAQNNNV